jgi:hypothetical protein
MRALSPAQLRPLLLARREQVRPAALEVQTLSEFADAYARVGAMQGYHHLPETAARIASGWQEAALEAALMQAALDRLDAVDALPPRLRHHHLRHLARIAEQAAPCRLDADSYRKDLGLATLRLFAAGNQVVDLRSGVPRSVLLRGSWWQAPAKLLAMLRLGGFKPYAQIHMHPLCRKPFDAETRAETYRSCAELLAWRRDSLGLLAGSWFYDPALAAVSPHLAYLHQVPKAGGAQFFFAADRGGFVEWALSSSATRRAAHAAGRYQPRSYLLVWGRQALTRWAAQHPAGLPTSAT